MSLTQRRYAAALGVGLNPTEDRPNRARKAASGNIAALRGKRVCASVNFWIAVGLIVAAFLIRLPNFGNPAYELDEEFYLLVGDRMLHGMLPYIDIWDRKPIGLFLLYAAIRLLGGDGILQYQIIAALFAGGTACLIHRAARPLAGQFGAVVAALAYLLWVETVEGGGGQAPIFYNLFVAGTAACTLAVFVAPRGDGAKLRKFAFAAMAFGGIAIQLKYTAVFEVAYFGALLAWRTLRDNKRLVAALETAALALTALVPTICAAGFYAIIGQFHSFWFANFQSVFHRSAMYPDELHRALVEMAKHVAPFAACYVASLLQLRASGDAEMRQRHMIVSGWVGAALAGYFSVGALFYHYMLPLFVPLSIAAAPIFRRWPIGAVMGAILLWFPLSNLNYPDFATTRYARERIAAMERLIPRDVDRSCMQMFAGPPILYLRTNACFVSRYVFPDHLVSRVETNAIGVASSAELRRIFARRPGAIVTNDNDYRLDPASFAVLKALRSRFYHHVGSVELDGRKIDIWVINTDQAHRPNIVGTRSS